MKVGKSLQVLAAEIDRQQREKRDFIVPMKQVEPYHHNGRLELGFLVKGDLFTAPLTEIGHDQLGNLCGIPAKYYDAMRAHPKLLAANVKHWLERYEEPRMIRSLDGNIRAILSNSYRRLDNYDLAQNVLPMLFEVGAEVESCEITERRLYIKAVTHRVQTEVKVGDVVSAGIVIWNSEVGHGSIAVKPMVYRLVCKNGYIAEDYSLRKYHVGRQIESLDVEFSNETKSADDHAFWLKVRDMVKFALSESSFKKIVSTMKQASEVKISEPIAAIEMLASDHALTKTEKEGVLAHLIQGGELSSYGLGSAVTRMAQDVESYDRATELEALGFEVMKRSWN